LFINACFHVTSTQCKFPLNLSIVELHAKSTAHSAQYASQVQTAPAVLHIKATLAIFASHIVKFKPVFNHNSQAQIIQSSPLK